MRLTFLCGLIIVITCQYAIAEVQIRRAASVTGGCQMMIRDTGWKEGESVSLENLQYAFTHIDFPQQWMIGPKKAIELLLELTPQTARNIIYHCKSSSDPKDANVIVTFYFTYTNSLNESVRTEDFKISILPVLPIAP